MKAIKERTYAKKLFSFIVGTILGWFFYLIVAAMFTPDGHDIPDLYGIIAFGASVLTMVIYMVFSEFNYLKRLELQSKSLISNISVFKKREQKLLQKTEAIVFKFLEHESDVQKSVAASRGGNSKKTETKLKNSSLSNLKVTLENYPELKSDKHISKILDQIEESQNGILNSKLVYNQCVTYYNSTIVSFPAVIFSGLWNLKPLSFYEDQNIDDDDLLEFVS